LPQNRQNPERPLTAAEKQRQYRVKQQNEADRLRTERNFADGGLLYQLERAVWNAAERGDALNGERVSPTRLADVVKSGSIEGMIENLTRHFEQAGNE
jgi:hypothetical protein